MQKDKLNKYFELLKNYIEIYINSMIYDYKEYNWLWTLYVLYLTAILPATVFILMSNFTIAIILIPIIHIAWIYGILIKNIDLNMQQTLHIFFENRINKIINIIDEDFSEYELIRYKKLGNIFSNYLKKPLGNAIEKFRTIFWMMPFICFVGTLVGMNLKFMNSMNEMNIWILAVALIYLIIGISIICIYYLKIKEKTNKEVEELLKSFDDFQEKKQKVRITK